MAHQFSALLGINLINDGFHSGNVKLFKDIGLGSRPGLGAGTWGRMTLAIKRAELRRDWRRWQVVGFVWILLIARAFSLVGFADLYL